MRELLTAEQNTTRRRLLKLTGTGLAVGLAGCTGSSGENATQPGHGETEHGHGGVGDPQESREVAVNTTDDGQSHFSPHVTRVTVDGTITWVLESGQHTVTAYHTENDQPRLVPEGTENWDSGTLSEQGEEFEHTFDTEGVYHYYCEPHEQGGMIATVIVGNPDPSEEIALESPPGDKSETVRAKLEELNGMVRSALSDDRHNETETGAHNDDSDGHHDETGTADHNE